MKNNHKILSIILALSILFGLTACGTKEEIVEPTEKVVKSDSLAVVKNATAKELEKQELDDVKEYLSVFGGEGYTFSTPDEVDLVWLLSCNTYNEKIYKFPQKDFSDEGCMVKTLPECQDFITNAFNSEVKLKQGYDYKAIKAYTGVTSWSENEQVFKTIITGGYNTHMYSNRQRQIVNSFCQDGKYYITTREYTGLSDCEDVSGDFGRLYNGGRLVGTYKPKFDADGMEEETEITINDNSKIEEYQYTLTKNEKSLFLMDKKVCVKKVEGSDFKSSPEEMVRLVCDLNGGNLPIGLIYDDFNNDGLLDGILSTGQENAEGTHLTYFVSKGKSSLIQDLVKDDFSSNNYIVTNDFSSYKSADRIFLIKSKEIKSSSKVPSVQIFAFNDGKMIKVLDEEYSRVSANENQLVLQNNQTAENANEKYILNWNESSMSFEKVKQ